MKEAGNGMTRALGVTFTIATAHFRPNVDL